MSFAYIFDVDGVLLRTMEAHFACYRQALAESNVPIDKAQFYTQAGMTGQEQIKYFADKAGVTVDVEKIYARKRELFQEHQGRGGNHRLQCPPARHLEIREDSRGHCQWQLPANPGFRCLPSLESRRMRWWERKTQARQAASRPFPLCGGEAGSSARELHRHRRFGCGH